MRSLTVKRNKKWLGCGQPVGIYIEDTTSNDINTITVDGKSCRFLGFIVSGGSLTVSIPDGEQKIYAVTPRSMQKSNISEAYVIPAGTEDVMLSGSVYFLSSFFKAVTFVFDGSISNEEKKKIKKKESLSFLSFWALGTVVLTAITLTVLFFSNYEPDKTFTNDGVSITLTTKFIEQSYDGFNFVYGTEDVVILGSKESFADYPELADYTNEEYGLSVLNANEFDPTVMLKPFGESYSFSYQAEGYYYFCVIYKSSDAFWLVQYATDVELAGDYADDFEKWANSVTFSQNY
ncbi:MAG: hypothetical protein IJD95_00880 [Clostridia bacterium]|nr:hypothetical protein [Clostridia bacterium]